MKSRNYWYLSLALLLFLACGGGKGTQKGPQQHDMPADLAKAYRDDAARLAVREILTTTQTGELAADVPQDRIDYFYGILSKVYFMSKKVDSIPDLSSIHTLAVPHLHRVRVVLSQNASFKDNWSKGYSTSSNLYLNQLMSKYKLVVKEYKESSIGPTCVLESPMYINTKELAFLIKNTEGIRDAEPEMVMGDGNNIEWGSDSKNAMAIRYSVGAGDCPSGCQHRKFWIFYVMPDGSINYMGTRGSVPPENDLK
jgi:hypothetical protein